VLSYANTLAQASFLLLKILYFRKPYNERGSDCFSSVVLACSQAPFFYRPFYRILFLLILWLVIDALDTYDNKRDIRIILKIIATTHTLSNVHLRIFITSKPEITIRISFRKIPQGKVQIFLLHEISPTIVNRNLGLFFKYSFSNIREERGFTDD